MKRTVINATFSKTVVLMTAFLAVIFFASPNLLSAAPKASAVDRNDARIVKMERSLKITPDQKELWNDLTDVMKENAEKIDELTKARADKTRPLNAVEDLKSYGEILDAHAEGMQKFIPAFEKLYDSMSDEQKKNADVLFKTHRHGKYKKSRTK